MCKKLKGNATFQHPRATLCGDRAGRCAEAPGHANLLGPLSMCKNPIEVLLFISPRNPLHRSRGSMCKNWWEMLLFNILAQPSAEIVPVDAQKINGLAMFETSPRNPQRGCGNFASGLARLLLAARGPWLESPCSALARKLQFLSARPVREVQFRSSS